MSDKDRRGLSLEGGENCLKYLKRRWNRKEGRGNNFKKGDKLDQGVDALKMGCLNPLTNYVLVF